MTDYKAKFRIGQIVHHKLFDYTGVIFDILEQNIIVKSVTDTMDIFLTMDQNPPEKDIVIMVYV